MPGIGQREVRGGWEDRDGVGEKAGDKKWSDHIMIPGPQYTFKLWFYMT